MTDVHADSGADAGSGAGIRADADVTAAAIVAGCDAARLIPIHTVARRYGISVVILRALERRYGVLRSTRSEHGHRSYCVAQMARIQAIAGALAAGVPLASMHQYLLDQGFGELCAHVGEDAGMKAGADQSQELKT